jgi:hypothetical protein
VQGEQQVALTDAQQAIVQLQEALARAEAQLEEHRWVHGLAPAAMGQPDGGVVGSCGTCADSGQLNSLTVVSGGKPRVWRAKGPAQMLPACCPGRSVSGHFAETVGARMTVLEGRVKLMEAQVGGLLVRTWCAS